MEKRKCVDEDGAERTKYVARLQSKYYFKFQKSLEHNRHGILSTLIIYKLLTYFLESDYNLNEDYYFDEEDCRQFYIRREILRAIASHTCDDIYQMYMGSFSFLLRICDDTQEWGRKYLSELYVKSSREYELQNIDLSFCKPEEQKSEESDNLQINLCTITEQMSVPDQVNAIDLIYRFREQALVYVTIFRDGQDTDSRDFSFVRKLDIKVSNIIIAMTLRIDKDEASQLLGELTLSPDAAQNAHFGKTFSDALSKKINAKCKYQLYNASQKPVNMKESDPASWRKGELIIPLTY